MSFVGYEPQTITVKDCDVDLNIALTSLGRDLDNVEITATSVQNKALIYQPASITKLSRTTIGGNGLFLDDAINGNVPGVIMDRRSVAGGQQFNIRSYGNGAREGMV